LSAVLEIKPQNGDPYEVPIGNTATIGRSAINDVSFPSCPLASRQHAILRCHNGRDYQIMDLGSLNGTYVDGNRVVFPVTLHDHARVIIGTNEIVFRTVATPRDLPMDDATIVSGTHFGPDREVAILVCDICGFSGFSEKLPAATLAKVLGNWFRESGNLVQASGGVIDKFIGDAMLAYWTDLPAETSACNRALGVADQLLAAAAKLTWPDSDHPFKVGIALHHGTVSHGNIGLVAQRDATIIGDAVNIAFRLEGIIKALDLQVILSETFHRRIDAKERFEDLGEKELKGKSRLVRIFGMK
jgi:adenylate cyclase